jgi:5-methyltetrahydropteroyltriglutamate--homocysteine methyltransferase
MRASDLPFFHAETVGSLPHPDELIAARASFDKSEISADALKQVEDRAIMDAIALQKRVGLQVVTDGELRRNTYIDFVTTGLNGVRMEYRFVDRKASYRDERGEEVATPRPQIVVFDRVRHKASGSMVGDFRYLAAHSDRPAKFTICGPAVIHFFAGRENISRDVYADLAAFWNDCVEAYRTELDLLHRAGCRYVQIDETSLIKLVDGAIREWLVGRGDDPDELLEVYVDTLRRIVDHAPKDMRMALHLCRGNNRGTWQAQGGYDGIAGRMFEKLSFDVYSLEFDSPRAGGFEPLRKLPDDAHVLLGLLSTKTRAVEDADAIIARIREAARVVPLERIGVSPQCGFWGGINLATPAETEAKLRRVVEIAERVWS